MSDTMSGRDRRAVRRAHRTVGLQTFINDLHAYIRTSPAFPARPGQDERASQNALQAIIQHFLLDFFRTRGVRNPLRAVSEAFYWGYSVGHYPRARGSTFASRNYPDFIILSPYNMAIEYKQDKNGSVMKQGIGQALMHTMGGEFKHSVLLFHDQSPGKRIESAASNDIEARVISKLEEENRVYVRFI